MMSDVLKYLRIPGAKPVLGLLLYITLIVFSDISRWIRLPIVVEPGVFERFIIVFQVFIAWFIGELTVGVMRRQSILQGNSNQIQKDNIKLQMFDKRYKVFQAVVDARSLLNREDHIMTGLYNASHLNNMGSQMTDTYNTLRDSLFISQTLFDKDIFEKMNRILSLFNNTRKSFYKLGVAGLKYNELIKQNESRIQQILVIHADNIEQMSIELNKIIPDFAEILKPWQASVVEFNDYLESSGIQKDFDSYLMIHNIDK